MTEQIVLITGTSSGFGRMAAEALTEAGHRVYGSMRDITGRNRENAASAERFSQSHGGKLSTLELDVCDQDSIDAAIARVIDEVGRIDVLIHNAGHMCVGPAESFTPEQLLHLYDVNAVGTQRVNRAALPHLRAAGRGYLLWIGSSSTAGGMPPWLAPYFAAKAGMDALAVSYASELARWGIESTVLVPGAFTQGTNHFAHAARPGDAVRAEAYALGPTADVVEKGLPAPVALEPADADPQSVADAIVELVGLPFGERPFRRHIDPIGDGAEEADAVGDRVQADLLHRIGFGDLLAPRPQP